MPALKKPKPQVIPEESIILGVKTGTVYARLAEGGKDESVKVKPLTRAYKPKTEKGAVQEYATGGELQLLGLDPNDPKVQERIKSGQLNYSTPLNQAADQGNYLTPTPTNKPLATAATATPTAASSTTATYGAAGTAQHAATQSVQQAQQAQINASGGVNTASAAQIEASRKAVAAAQKAQLAQGGALDASNASLDVQATNTAKSKAEEQAIQSAAANVADKRAVAQAQAVRQGSDYLYDIAGVGRPVEIASPNGADFAHDVPGVRAKLMTQEELVTQDAAKASKLRGFDVDTSRIGAARAEAIATAAGNDAQLADLMARAAGLDVNAERLKLDAAGLNLDQQRLNLEITKTPPNPGEVYNADTGTWMTAQQAELHAAQTGLVVDPTSNTFVQRQDLLSRTDTYGNIRRADGVVVDPKTHNEFVNIPNVGMTWRDPETKNYQEPGTGIWVSPEGYRRINNQWFDPRTGAYLGNDGIWFNPVTGTSYANAQQFGISGPQRNGVTSYDTGRGLANAAQDYAQSPDGLAASMFQTTYSGLSADQKGKVDAEYARLHPGSQQSAADVVIANALAAALTPKQPAAALTPKQP